ncbi:MAG TPA: L-threonylcarbamoyladenylate synthase [Thermomicrobiales bacterium]|nr:L-threonylcarbamoyladenylate synthase [Thermomicrobiales bacterium]
MSYLSLEDKRALETAIATMQGGGVIAFPTDTVYGIGASLSHRDALTRVYDIKGRSHEKPLPVLVSRADVIDRLANQPDPELLRLASHFWPGPLTIILKAGDTLPTEVIAPDGTFGVRIPDHSIALTIAQHNGGAIAVSSANRSGEPPACHAEEILQALGGEIDVILDGGIAPRSLASTVIRREDDTITVIREGAISSEIIQEAWNEMRVADEIASTAGTMTSPGR